MIGYHLPAACVGNSHPLVLESMKCPLSLQMFKEPVLLVGDNRTYEKELIEKWLHDHNTSPITREKMLAPRILENRSFKDFISEFLLANQSVQYSDAQFLSPISVVEFHNALLGFVPADKSLQASLKTRQQQLLSSFHLNNKAKPAEILSFIRTLLENDPRLAIITFESTHEKISAFQFACKHAENDDILLYLYSKIKYIYKSVNKSICTGLLRGVLRGRYVGLVQLALAQGDNTDDFELLKAMGISSNFMFLTASSSLSREYIQKAVEYGATPSVKGKNGFSALMEAVVHKNSSAVPYLVEQCKLTIKPSIPYAFIYRNDDILGYLLGCLLGSSKHSDGSYPSISNIPTIHLLVSKTLLDDWGRDRMSELIKKVIESKDPIHKSPHIDVVDNIYNHSALCIAIYNNLLEFAKILLSLGAKPTMLSSPTTTPVTTPLHVAARLGNVSIMTELIKYLGSPSDINILDIHGRSPLDEAVYVGQHEIVKLLVNSPLCNVQVSFAELQLMSSSHPDMAQLLMKKKMRPVSLQSALSLQSKDSQTAQQFLGVASDSLTM